MVTSPFDTTFKVGRIERAEGFEEARKPGMLKLWIDLGDGKVQSAAQLAENYDPGELVGRQVLCATDLGSVRIAGFKSEVLTVGVDDGDGNPVVLTPDIDVPTGAVLH